MATIKMFEHFAVTLLALLGCSPTLLALPLVPPERDSGETASVLRMITQHIEDETGSMLRLTQLVEDVHRDSLLGAGELLVLSEPATDRHGTRVITLAGVLLLPEENHADEQGGVGSTNAVVSYSHLPTR
jgi:hypothetical protein